ncbi:hypothetical protein LPC08_07570 [Roseomonas sp. OT10]|uniref:hypothetical protein n=1 Tax=Roseomonas cutis TaxID=2897332 RepID=UPI001E337B69|nr:hypothetical protein [Roseomonas sp. OT10]UFN50465.1 hypothetical protein LPC08_07570 [Roseomonas sp. OT10]
MSDDLPPVPEEAGFAVRIRDLSGGNGSEPVETIRGFVSAEHANAFARRYVRDSVELCRARGMDAKEVLAAWFAFGEDADVLGAGDEAWSSATELAGFAAYPPEDEEERDWRVLDPRRDGEDEGEEDEA